MSNEKHLAFPVQLDTGSSDLWVSGLATQNIHSSGQLNDNNLVEIVYGVGNVFGNVMFADIEFGGFTIQNQGTKSLCKDLNILTNTAA